VNPYTKKKIYQTPDSPTQVFVFLMQGTSVATSDDKNLDELLKENHLSLHQKSRRKQA